MTETRPPSATPDPAPSPHDYPTAAEHSARRFPLIWLIPLVALLVAGYLAYQAIAARGPTITLSFKSAEGLKAGQTKVRHKAVELGTVDTIQLSDDMSHVLVRVKMQHEASAELTNQARFWVVRPRFNAGNISGLDTLVSGSYIELDPGAPGAGPVEKEVNFTGLDEPPAVRSDEPGQTYTLPASRIGGLSSGSPVVYRDVTVGEVLRWEMAPDGAGFTVSIFVRKPFDRFVHRATHFWNASGVGVDLGANGVQLRLESLQALLNGAIAFDTAAEMRDTPASPENSQFQLYPNEQTASSAGYTRRLPFVTRFEGSVRGLAVGAPVETYGIQVGEVTAVKLHFDPSGNDTHVEVRFELQPERILSAAEIASGNPLAATQTMVSHGLRVQLLTANYLTGQRLLGLDFVPDAPPGVARALKDGTIFVPGVAGGLDTLQASVTDLVQKIGRVPFEQIGTDLATTMHAVSGLTGGPELKQSLMSLQTALASVQDLVRKVDAGSTPLLKRLPEMAQTLQATLERAAHLVASTDTGYGGDSQVKRDLDRMLVEINDSARSVRLLADYLSAHPDALIQGRSGRASEK